MTRHSYISLLLFGIFSWLQLPAQTSFEKIDKFKSKLADELSLSEKLSIYDSIIYQYLFSDKNTALYYELDAIRLAAESDNDTILQDTYERFSYLNYEFGNSQDAIRFGEKAIELSLQLKDSLRAADLYVQQEIYYDVLGDYPSSLKMAQKALELYTAKGDLLGQATCLNDIGIVHYYSGRDSTALIYLNKSLDMHLSLNDSSGIANCYNNIANVYSDRGEYERSLGWYYKGLKIDQALNKVYGQSITLNNIGETYLELKEFDKAKETLHESLELAKVDGDVWTITNPLRSLADFYLSQKDYSKAIEYAQESVRLSDSIGALSELSDAYFMLSKIYKRQKSFELALQYVEKYDSLQDSIFNKDNSALISEMESKYQSDQKNSEISLLKSQKEVEDLKHRDELEAHQRKITYSIAGAIIFIIIIIIVLWALISNRKANAHLKQQQLVIEEKNKTLNIAFEEIEEKNKEITDSINYAKRIQTAILPSSSSLNKYLSDSFVLYKPKDIVAGDFYWLHPVYEENKLSNIFFAAADCTGHGVPGAMVSVVCNNALNRAVQEYGLLSTNQILDKVNEIVSKQFGKSEESVRDGMDIAICNLDVNTLELEYSGANNPLWIITKNASFYEKDLKEDGIGFYPSNNNSDNGIVELSPNKQPIGLFARTTPFKSTKIKLQKGDSIYIFTDGYVDQFGGPKGKKFKHKPFKNLLLSYLDLPISNQKETLDIHFEKWRGQMEQIDDVCVIGVKI